MEYLHSALAVFAFSVADFKNGANIAPANFGKLSRHKNTGVYGNRIHWELCSNPPLVLKTRAITRCANTPKAINP